MAILLLELRLACCVHHLSYGYGRRKKKSTDGWREVDGWRCSTCVLSCLVVPDSEATRDAEAETDADRKSSPSMDQRHMMSAEVAPIGVLDAPASAY